MEEGEEEEKDKGKEKKNFLHWFCSTTGLVGGTICTALQDESNESQIIPVGFPA